MIIDEFKKGLAAKPYVSDTIKSEKPFVKITTKKHAEKYKYIQPNHPQVLKNLCLDLDNSKLKNHNYYEDFEWLNVPPPNIKINNPTNGHCHLIYILDNSIYTKNEKQLKFFNFEKDVLNFKLDGDFAFRNNLIKNPLHENWDTKIIWEKPYTLNDLYEHSYITNHELKQLKDKKAQITNALDKNAGRNCALYEEVRHYAYKAFYESDDFDNDVFKYAYELNSLITSKSGPLPLTELKTIVRSIIRYIYGNFNKDFDAYVKESHSSEKQRINGIKSGKARAIKSNVRKEQIIQLLNDGKNITQIADELRISRMTVNRLLKASVSMGD